MFINFCSGLPRSGSTLLMNILQQHPEIFTTSTCALQGLLEEHMLKKSRYREHFQAMDSEQADAAMYGAVRGAAYGWFSALSNKPTIISKNRSWSRLLHLFPEGKTLVCVRDLRDIVNSFNKLNNNIKALHSFGDTGLLYAAMTDSDKYHYHFKESNAFSAALYDELPRLMEAFKDTSYKIKFIRYEDLTQEPEYMLQRINEFLGVSAFSYNLNCIEQSKLFEHDNAYFREKTCHKVHPKLKLFKDVDRSISASLQQQIVDNNQWFYKSFYPNIINE